MILPINAIFEITKTLLIFSILIQCFEYIKIELYANEQLKASQHHFMNWYFTTLCIRVLVSVLMIYNSSPILFIIQIVLYLLILKKWKGLFNGGSDSLTFLILVALTVGVCFGFKKAALYYIAVQSIVSYFIAGIGKLRHSEWRNGQALRIFIENSIITRQGRLVENIVIRHTKIFSWMILVFELLFPLCLINIQFCFLFILMGVGFHIGNFYFFGLNRFFWIWMTTYPSVIYLANSLSTVS